MMKRVYNIEGKLVGKFDEKKARLIATSRENCETRWCEILRTAKGNYILKLATMWQDEKDTYAPIEKEEVIELMEKWGYSQDEIKIEFPGYEPWETI